MQTCLQTYKLTCSHELTHTPAKIQHLTWNPTSCTSWARITWDRPLRSRNANRALQLKKWAVPRRVLNVNPWCSFMSFITSGVTRSRLKVQEVSKGTLSTVSPENICMTMGNVGNWSILWPTPGFQDGRHIVQQAVLTPHKKKLEYTLTDSRLPRWKTSSSDTP